MSFGQGLRSFNAIPSTPEDRHRPLWSRPRGGAIGEIDGRGIPAGVPGRGRGDAPRGRPSGRRPVHARPLPGRGEALWAGAAPEGRRAVRRCVRRPGARALRGQHRPVPRRRFPRPQGRLHVHRPRLSDCQRLRPARRLRLRDPGPARARRRRSRGRRGAGPRDRPHHRPPRLETPVQGHPRGPRPHHPRGGHRQPGPRQPRARGGARGAERVLAQGGARGGRDRRAVPQPGRLRTPRDVELPRQAEAPERVRGVPPRPLPPPRAGLLRHPSPNPRTRRAGRRGGEAHVGGGPHHRARHLPLEDRRTALRRRPGAGLRPGAAVRASGHPLLVRGPAPVPPPERGALDHRLRSRGREDALRPPGDRTGPLARPVPARGVGAAGPDHALRTRGGERNECGDRARTGGPEPVGTGGGDPLSKGHGGALRVRSRRGAGQPRGPASPPGRALFPAALVEGGAGGAAVAHRGPRGRAGRHRPEPRRPALRARWSSPTDCSGS